MFDEENIKTSVLTVVLGVLIWYFQSSVTNRREKERKRIERRLDLLHEFGMGIIETVKQFEQDFMASRTSDIIDFASESTFSKVKLIYIVYFREAFREVFVPFSVAFGKAVLAIRMDDFHKRFVASEEIPASKISDIEREQYIKESADLKKFIVRHINSNHQELCETHEKILHEIGRHVAKLSGSKDEGFLNRIRRYVRKILELIQFNDQVEAKVKPQDQYADEDFTQSERETIRRLMKSASNFVERITTAAGSDNEKNSQ